MKDLLQIDHIMSRRIFFIISAKDLEIGQLSVYEGLIKRRNCGRLLEGAGGRWNCNLFIPNTNTTKPNIGLEKSAR